MGRKMKEKRRVRWFWLVVVFGVAFLAGAGYIHRRDVVPMMKLHDFEMKRFQRSVQEEALRKKQFMAALLYAQKYVAYQGEWKKVAVMGVFDGHCYTGYVGGPQWEVPSQVFVRLKQVGSGKEIVFSSTDYKRWYGTPDRFRLAMTLQDLRRGIDSHHTGDYIFPVAIN
ncbi:MAG: hypothetical protein A3J76_03385 [Candidatus Moranbacteria bacterium RBG_13_45_13]|nr:MAG: hypothetical protein A3J76_03385 [Candidatus Moranbacteria bacterium RBG_13_45_13]